MAGNRKAAEAEIIKWIGAITPGNDKNVNIYKERFKQMSDKEFDLFMTQLENEEIFLSVVAPNFGDIKITAENNFKVARDLGHNFFERIWIDDDNGEPPYLSNYECIIIDLPIRRQAQLLTKKVSIPKNNNVIDNLTGQPTSNTSKGARISYPELQVISALGLDNCAVELIKYRGGDLKGFNAMNTSISKTGGVSMKDLDTLGTKTRSTTILSVYLKAMHLNPTGLN